MALHKATTAPIEGNTEHAAPPAELHDSTTPVHAAELDPEFSQGFDHTGTLGETVAATHQVATKASAPLSILDGVRDEAFSSLDSKIGYGSFPMIMLDKDKFIIVAGKEEVDEFDCHVLFLRPKWIHKTTDQNGPIFYAYDGQLTTSGDRIADKLKAWEVDGFKYAGAREYSEVTVIMKTTSLTGDMALLSVPPSSVKRLAGYRATLNAIKRVEINAVITKCLKGAKVTTGNKDTFYPWDFKFVELASV